MADIVERLRFDATRCELQFSKGVAQNIEEAAAKIERLRSLLREAIPHIEGSQNTTSVEAYNTAGDLLTRIRAAVDEQQVQGGNDGPKS